MQRQKPFVNIPFIFVCPWKEDDMMYTHNFVMVDMIWCAKWKLYLHHLSQNLKDGFCIHKSILMAFLYVNFTYLPSVLYWYLRIGRGCSFLNFIIELYNDFGKYHICHMINKGVKRMYIQSVYNNIKKNCNSLFSIHLAVIYANLTCNQNIEDGCCAVTLELLV